MSLFFRAFYRAFNSPQNLQLEISRLEEADYYDINYPRIDFHEFHRKLIVISIEPAQLLAVTNRDFSPIYLPTGTSRDISLDTSVLIGHAKT